MRLYGEIMQKTGLREMFRGERCLLLLGGGGYFQGVKGIVEFSQEKIRLAFHNGEGEMTGKGLWIEKYCDGDAEIGGEIFSFVFFKKESLKREKGV